MLYVLLLFWCYTASLYADTSALGVSLSSPWWHLLTYSFIHTSILHLTPNCILHLYYWRYLRRFSWLHTVPILIAATLISAALSRYAEPTVGSSAVVLAEAGIVLADIKQRKPLIRAAFLLSVAFTTTAVLAPHVNTRIHVISLLTAFLLRRAELTVLRFRRGR